MTKDLNDIHNNEVLEVINDDIRDNAILTILRDGEALFVSKQFAGQTLSILNAKNSIASLRKSLVDISNNDLANEVQNNVKVFTGYYDSCTKPAKDFMESCVKILMDHSYFHNSIGSPNRIFTGLSLEIIPHLQEIEQGVVLRQEGYNSENGKIEICFTNFRPPLQLTNSPDTLLTQELTKAIDNLHNSQKATKFFLNEIKKYSSDKQQKILLISASLVDDLQQTLQRSYQLQSAEEINKISVNLLPFSMGKMFNVLKNSEDISDFTNQYHDMLLTSLKESCSKFPEDKQEIATAFNLMCSICSEHLGKLQQLNKDQAIAPYVAAANNELDKLNKNVEQYIAETKVQDINHSQFINITEQQVIIEVKNVMKANQDLQKDKPKGSKHNNFLIPIKKVKNEVSR